MSDVRSPGLPARAVARTRVTMQPATSAKVAANEMKKGDVLSTARYAGIRAAHSSPSLLTLPAGQPIGAVTVSFDVGDGAIGVEASVEADDAGRAEVPALAAAAVAALTIFDMCKSVDRTMNVEELALVT